MFDSICAYHGAMTGSLASSTAGRTSRKSPTMIVVQGFPAVGKEKIAKMLSGRLSGRTTVFPCHVTIDPAVIVYPKVEDSAFSRSLSAHFRGAIKNHLIELGNSIADYVIFTAANTIPKDGEASPYWTTLFNKASEYVEVADSINARLIVVTLECEEEENVSRLNNRETRGSKMKEPARLRDWRVKSDIHQFGDLAYANWTVDTSNKSPEEVVDDILGKFTEKIAILSECISYRGQMPISLIKTVIVFPLNLKKAVIRISDIVPLVTFPEPHYRPMRIYVRISTARDFVTVNPSPQPLLINLINPSVDQLNFAPLDPPQTQVANSIKSLTMRDRRFIILIKGYPATGKLSVAKDLNKYWPEATIIPNHLLIDPIAQLCDRNHAHYAKLRLDFKRALFDTFTEQPGSEVASHLYSQIVSQIDSYPEFEEPKSVQVKSELKSKLDEQLACVQYDQNIPTKMMIFTETHLVKRQGGVSPTKHQSQSLNLLPQKEYTRFAREINATFISIVLTCSWGENDKRLRGRPYTGGDRLYDSDLLREIRKGFEIFWYERNEVDMELTVNTDCKDVEEVASEIMIRLSELCF